MQNSVALLSLETEQPEIEGSTGINYTECHMAEDLEDGKILIISPTGKDPSK